MINEYIERHPEQRDVFAPYYELSKYDEDVVSVIRNGDFTDEQAQSLYEMLVYNRPFVNNKDEMYKILEKSLDSEEIDDDVKSAIGKLLEGMENLGYQRNATIIQTREQKVKRDRELQE